jgi:pyroglutamyl-peptidase
MAHTTTKNGARPRPALMVTGFGPFPGAPHNPTADVIERLLHQQWAPPGFAVHGLVAPVLWGRSAEVIAEAIRASGCNGALLLGIAGKAREFRVEMRAANHVDRRRPDADGKLWRGDKIDPTGPASARSTAPVADMMRAIEDAGYPSVASSDAGDYLCNFSLYRILTGLGDGAGAPPVGFLHVPRAVLKNGEDALLEVDDMERAVKAAVRAFALHLAPQTAILATA